MEDESKAERRARHRGAPAKAEDPGAKPRGRRALSTPEPARNKEQPQPRNPEPAVRDQFSALAKNNTRDPLDVMRAATCASLALVAAVLLALIHPPDSGYLEWTLPGIVIPLLMLGVSGWFLWRGRQAD